MDKALKDISSENRDTFPSVRLLVALYSVFAAMALVVSFLLNLDSEQITVCLLVSWLLTSGALAMSIFLEISPIDASDDDY